MKNKNNKEILNAAEMALNEQFKGISKSHIAKAFYEVESSRASFLTKAIVFGFGALAMKAQIKHGEFKNWLIAALEEHCPKLPQCGNFENGSSWRTAYRYMHLAKMVIKQIEEPNENSTIAIRLVEFCQLNHISKEALPKILKSPSLTLKLIKFISNGYSLRSLQTALKVADENAKDEEDQEALEEIKNSLGKKSSKQMPTSIIKKDELQTDFFDALMRHTDAIKTDIEAGYIDRLNKDELTSFAKELEAQLQLIKSILKNRND